MSDNSSEHNISNDDLSLDECSSSILYDKPSTKKTKLNNNKEESKKKEVIKNISATKSSKNSSTTKIINTKPVTNKTKEETDNNVKDNTNLNNITSTATITNQSNNNDITRGPPITTDSSAKKLIIQYLTQQNRPYSAIQIHDNLHKRIPKPVVERVLNSICSSNDSSVLCKEYGKAKIYFIDQNTLTSNYTSYQLDELTNENDRMKISIDQLANEERSLNAKLQGILNEPNDDELESLITELQTTITAKTNKIKQLSIINNENSINNNNNKQNIGSFTNNLSSAIHMHNFYRSIWLNRKQLCMSTVDMLSEGMGKKVKDIMSEMCLESDQDFGVILPSNLSEPKSK